MEERELKDKAIVLSTADSGEVDRIITLLTLSNGLIRAKIKGVKKPKAKLAYASFPFNFGEYIIVKSGKNNTVINCNYIDNFQSISYDINKFYAGSAMLEISSKLAKENGETYELFMTLLKCLNKLCYDENSNIYSIVIKFLIEVLKFSGFKIGEEQNYKEDNLTFFDFAVGKVTNMASDSAVQLADNEKTCLLSAQRDDLDDFDYSQKGSRNVLKMLVLFFEDKVEEDIKVIKKFI